MRAVFTLAAGASAVSAGTIDSVVTLLTNMKSKSVKEMESEQIAFAKYDTHCNTEHTRLTGELASSKEDIAEYSSNMEAASGRIDNMDAAISKASDKIVALEADLKSKTEKNKKEVAEHEALIKDYSESVSALDRAFRIIKNNNKNVASVSLLQTTAGIPERAKALIADYTALTQDSTDDLAFTQQPQANTYAFRSESGGVLDMLRDLQDKFRNKLRDQQKAKVNCIHSFNMAKQDITDEVNLQKNVVEQSQMIHGEQSQILAEQTGMHDAEVSEQAAFTQEKKVADRDCKEQRFSYKERQQLRGDEIEAIQQAVEVLQGGMSSINYTAFNQQKTSFVQVGARHKAHAADVEDVLDFLSAQGKKYSSEKLSLLAAKVQGDPFGKVKNMIKAMLEKLEKEGGAELQKENACKLSVAQSITKRKHTRTRIAKLQTAIDSNTSKIASLTEKIGEKNQENTDLARQRADETATREEQKAANKNTIEEAVKALAAVQEANRILTEFYAKASSATAFVQLNGVPMGGAEWDSLANPNFVAGGEKAGYGQGPTDKVDTGHREGMNTFGNTEGAGSTKAYKGKQDENNAVIGLLEVVESDIANTKSDTETLDATQAKDYKDSMNAIERSKAANDTFLTNAKADKASAESQLKADDEEQYETERKLLLQQGVWKTVVKTCQGYAAKEFAKGNKEERSLAAKPLDTADRNAKRQAEITSLKEALEMLKDKTI